MNKNKRKAINEALNKHTKVETIVVAKPVIMVVLSYQNGSKKKKFQGYGWAKWSTVDMKTASDIKLRIEQLEKSIADRRQYVEEDEDDLIAQTMASCLVRLNNEGLAKIDWDEKKGITLAKGRARQMLFHKLVEDYQEVVQPKLSTII